MGGASLHQLAVRFGVSIGTALHPTVPKGFHIAFAVHLSSKAVLIAS